MHAYIGEGKLVAEIKDRLNDAGALLLADYRGLTVKEMQELRDKLRAAGSELKVYKNSLTEIAIRELALPSLDELPRRPDRLHLHRRGSRCSRQGADPRSPRRTRRSSSRADSSRTRSSTPTASRPSRRCRLARSSSPSCSAPCSTRSAASPASSTDRSRRSPAPFRRSRTRRPPRSGTDCSYKTCIAGRTR